MLGDGLFQSNPAIQAEEPDTKTEVEAFLEHRLQEGVADRRPPQAELLAQASLFDHRSWSELERDDLIPDQEVGALALGAHRAAFEDDSIQRRLWRAASRRTSGREFARQASPPVYRPYASDISAVGAR